MEENNEQKSFEITEADLRAKLEVIEKENRAKSESCMAEVIAVLTKHNCMLTSSVVVYEGQVVKNEIVVKLNSEPKK